VSQAVFEDELQVLDTDVLYRRVSSGQVGGRERYVNMAPPIHPNFFSDYPSGVSLRHVYVCG
jgi:hypothetical protein